MGPTRALAAAFFQATRARAAKANFRNWFWASAKCMRLSSCLRVIVRTRRCAFSSKVNPTTFASNRRSFEVPHDPLSENPVLRQELQELWPSNLGVGHPRVVPGRLLAELRDQHMQRFNPAAHRWCHSVVP